MLKSLSLYKPNAYREGILVPAYLVLGMAMAPTSAPITETIPDLQNVLLQECHKSCHVASGKEYCTYQCSYKDTQRTQRPVRH